MGLKQIQDDFPLIYKNFFPQFFKSSIPEETLATCSNCAMVCNDPSKKDQLAQKTYLPDRKCCTYHPNIPNYLIGGLLSDTDPSMTEGKNRIREKIKARTGVTPLGVYSPKYYSVLYKSGSSSGFGLSKNLICPYFVTESGACSVWKYREAVCSTYFCKTVGGDSGKVFWEGIKRYLSRAQTALIQYALLKTEFTNIENIMDEHHSYGSDNLTLSLEDLDNLSSSDENYEKLWGGWIGREEEFYISCYNHVNVLTEEQYKSVSGIAEEISIFDLESKRSNMMDVPSVLKKNDEIVFKENENDDYVIKLLKVSMSLKLPKPVLDFFDGALTNAEVKEKLAIEHMIELDDEIILTLYKNSILV